MTKGTLLIVDDEASVRKVLGESLRRTGFDIELAANGTEALRRLALPGVDLLLLDLQLGDMDGVEVMREARNLWPHLPIVMLTAHGSLPSAIEAVRCGAADYLLKPISLNELRERVEQVLERFKASHARSQQLQDLFTRMQTVLEGQGLFRQTIDAEPAPPQTIFVSGPLRLDTARHTVMMHDQPVDVTPSEFVILHELLLHPGAVVNCRQLTTALSTPVDDEEEARQIIRPHIVRLRRKLEPTPQEPHYLISVRSLGYRWSGVPE